MQVRRPVLAFSVSAALALLVLGWMWATAASAPSDAALPLSPLAGKQITGRLARSDKAGSVPPGVHGSISRNNDVTDLLRQCDPPTNLAFDWSPLQPGENVEVLFTASADGAEPLTYDWDFGDGAIGSGITAPHSYASAGDYAVALLVSNACGFGFITDTITVFSSSLTPMPTPTDMPTPTPTSTSTPTPTQTSTPKPTPTSLPPFTPNAWVNLPLTFKSIWVGPTRTPTLTPSQTPLPSATPTPTTPPTATPSPTFTPRPTNPPTATRTPTVPMRPRSGFWRETPWYSQFYVTSDRAYVDDFEISIDVPACGLYNYKITHGNPEPINNNTFSFSGSFYANGTFTSETRCTGRFGLSNYYIPGCGYVTLDPHNYTSYWQHYGQGEQDSAPSSLPAILKDLLQGR